MRPMRPMPVIDKKQVDARKDAERGHAGKKDALRQKAISTLETVLEKIKTGEAEMVPEACPSYAATEPKGCPGKEDYGGCPGCDRHGGAMARMPKPPKPEEPEGTIFDRLQGVVDAIHGVQEELT